jgi:E3 ubiquitin-protein ligase TRIP12
MIVDMIPNMTALLSSSDHKMVESACMCFSRLVDSCHTSDVQLEAIAAQGALKQLVRLLRPGDKEGRSFELSTGTYTSVVKTLAMSCRGSPSIAVALLEEGIVQVWLHLRV